MKPIFLWYGQLLVGSYELFVCLGFLAAFSYSFWQARRRDLDLVHVTNIQLLILLGGLGGSHLLAGLVHWKSFSNAPLQVFAFWAPGGRIWYGGFLGALALALTYARYQGLPGRLLADIAAPTVALGHGIGRLGCFLAGCCYGRPSNHPWAVTYRFADAATVSRHPTQLYESFAMLALFAALHRYLQRSDRPEGAVMAIYLIAYGAIRFAVEALRGDDRGSWIFGVFSTSQWLSLVALVAGGLLLRRLTSSREGTAA